MTFCKVKKYNLGSFIRLPMYVEKNERFKFDINGLIHTHKHTYTHAQMYNAITLKPFRIAFANFRIFSLYLTRDAITTDWKARQIKTKQNKGILWSGLVSHFVFKWRVMYRSFIHSE